MWMMREEWQSRKITSRAHIGGNNFQQHATRANKCKEGEGMGISATALLWRRKLLLVYAWQGIYSGAL